MTATGRLHWTQRPENREKVQLMARKAALSAANRRTAADKVSRKPLNAVKRTARDYSALGNELPLIDRHKQLLAEAVKRVATIDHQIAELKEERRELVETFTLDNAAVEEA